MEAGAGCSLILDRTKLSIEKQVCAEALRVVGAPRKKDQEIEVRFGYLLDSRHQSGLSDNLAEARQRWYQLYRLLDSSELYTAPTQEKTRVETFGNLRKITDLAIPSAPQYQEKKKQSSLDLLQFQVGNLNYYCRLTTSLETPRPGAISSGIPDSDRIRTRVSFAAKDGSHRFDLTYVNGKGYEVEIEYLAVMDLKSFFTPIKLVVHILKGASELVTKTEFTTAISTFNNFFKQETKFDLTKFYRRGLPQPVNLKRTSALGSYAVTNKLNGTRMVGIFVNSDLYLINMVGQVVKLLTRLPARLDKTVVDLEFFREVCYCFDLLFEAGTDCRNLNLDLRLGKLDKLVQTVNNPLFRAKKFYLSGDLAADTIQVFEEIDRLPPEDNDGLIYTPITEPYFNSHIYKWKPPEQLTIDFDAAQIEPNRYSLRVKDKFDRLVTFTVPGFGGVINSRIPLKGVGEYRWTGNTFELVRERPDKDLPNFIDIAKDVWDDIQNPIHREDLIKLVGKSEDDRDALRKFNNSIKRELISKYLPGKVVLDLGAGKGGDLSKYSFAKIARLYAVEPNKVHLAELKNRAEAMEKRHQLGFTLVPIQARAQETNTLLTEMKSDKVGAATMFFSLSFFFEHALGLDELVRTLAETVDREGLFLGTTIDGEMTRALFNKKGTKAQLGNVTLERLYSNFSGPIGFNKMISFTYSGSETVAEQQFEYLVDWNVLVEKLRNVGFVLENTSLFSPPAWISPEEQEVAKLYRSFVFKRVSLGSLQSEPTLVEKKKKGLLASGTNMKFKSVLADEINIDLVRTGTHADGDCFFHAVLMATDVGYRTKKSADQRKQAQEFRQSFKVDRDAWMKLGNGNLARVGSSEDLPGFDTILYRNLLDTQGYADKKIHILMAFNKNLDWLRTWVSDLGRNRKIQNLSLPQYIPAIVDLFTAQVQNREGGAKAIEEFKAIVQASQEEAYEVFATLLGTCGAWVGQEVLELVSDRIGRDIFILEDGKGDVYRIDCDHVRLRPSIVLLFQGKVHYETIGQVLPGNKIKREFEVNDPLIALIRKKIC